MFTVLAVASAEMLIVPVPEASDIAEFVDTKEVPPEPDVIVIEVAPVALPNGSPAGGPTATNAAKAANLSPCKTKIYGDQSMNRSPATRFA
jgi:hypothetical protein